MCGVGISPSFECFHLSDKLSNRVSTRVSATLVHLGGHKSKWLLGKVIDSSAGQSSIFLS